MTDDLHRLEEWFGQILQGLAPKERRRAALKLGQALRRSNLARIAANTQADGTPMAQKKARFDRRKRLRQAAGGKMFKGLRYAKRWKLDVHDDGLTLAPASAVADRFGATNQWGEIATVGRLRNGKSIRYRYPERRLLGISPADESQILEVSSQLVSAGM